MFKVIAFLFIIFSFGVKAKEISTIEIYTKIKRLVAELEKKDNIDLVNDLKKLEDLVSAYTTYKEKECKGEFAALSIDSNSEVKYQVDKKKLTADEKKLCLIELITFRKDYTNTAYDLRKKYMQQLHQAEIRQLEENRKQSINVLDKLNTKLVK